MTDFRMPSLGADMEEGTVLEWRVGPGEAFSKGDVIVDVDTDKAAFEVEADHDGVIEEILVEPGTTVPVGTVLARLEGGEEAAVAEETGSDESRSGDRSHPGPATPTVGATSRSRPPARPRQVSAEPSSRRRISPRARRRAEELGVDPAAITEGSGVDGAIEARDVEAAAAAGGAGQAPERPADKGDRQARLRGVIAAAMSRSKREIPHYYLDHAIDLEPALSWLERINAERGIRERLLPNVLLLKAAANALGAVPELNGYWVDGALEQHQAVHLGVAISLRGGGVIAPALENAGEKSVDTLMAELSDLVKRVRTGSVRHREMTTGTITVTSLGDRGTDAVTGVIFPPQVALVGFGTPRLRPWVVENEVCPRRVVIATLAADHRASDGHRGALFLRAIADQLQEPESL